ncbi:EAL domain-containing protein (putative c-di-GMP-specific phosphodiesterase class I)/CHASE2 domain-containing sensor protein [Sphingomonas endophytica]|uniref:EAL domain-containing protein (Putative c-di-GMP-specific phosphodiesterase class I)/CHASE2 domain-containing sensor protein n=1 Tax=Sphingomonas endophytica TaxID=869719 RepID=A0A7X0MPF3_9SPHN|nr:EAL domain-containing protein [Sphingomonas endophytica]MBB6506146.1 EAL domain-containing protein (putative c-di-GMP-specific phosphodiesterase class I)/CHASE2 domain-containing sensor protein [Sphingomonas endophytica]
MRPSSNALILVAAALVGMAAMLPGIGGPIRRALEPLRFAVQSHAASQQVAIVEMDARSVAAIRRWPWPRHHYAAVIDRLRAAGAATIVFDVDFSSASNPVDDRAFAAALKRAGGKVTLPTFGQQAGAGDVRTLDALPLDTFRAHAALASVSFSPDVDGLVRALPFATITAGTPRPSLSAYIAARPGVADADYPVDFSVDPATIPRLSFVAVEHGRFDPALVRGRNILIGATAIEMGDRYPAPLRGVLPGVTIQALGAETLLRGVPTRGTPLATFALALLLCLPGVRARRRDVAAGIFTAGLVALAVVVLAAQRWLAIHFPLGLGWLMLATAGGLFVTRDIFRRFRAGRLHDEATGLPNQRALVGQRAGRTGVACVVQLTNLEELSAVFDIAQVAQGIVRTAERLRLCSAWDAVYRVRSHQLALLLPTHEIVEDQLATLRTLLLQPVEIAGRKVDVAVALGIAEDGDMTAAALAAGDAAAAGVFWRRAAHNRDRLENAVSLMGELDAAIAAGQIEVHYQPKLALATDRIASVEALVRWRHPERGFVSPGAFVPLAEQTDRIEPLTLHVLSRVIADAARWRDAGHAVTAAVNISAKLLDAPAFIAAVDRLLDTAPIAPEALIFEVTESAAMSDPTVATATLHHFRRRGVAISMDDYGTGQSTLSYLRELPLSELKIDRSFVQYAHERESDAKLVRSTIDLAHALGLKVVAEGIEDAENLAFLRGVRCDYAQGYFIDRPMPFDALVTRLHDRNAPGAPATQTG